MTHRHERPPRPLAVRLEPDRVAFSRDNEKAPAVIDGVHTFNAFSNSAGGIVTHQFFDHFFDVDRLDRAI